MKFFAPFALVLALSLPFAAHAQQAPAPDAAKVQAAAKKRAPKAKTPPKNASELVLVNARSAAVTGLALTNAAGKNLAVLKKPLEPGKKISFKLPAKSGCLFTIDASFADESPFDASEVDLCIDKTVRFTD